MTIPAVGTDWITAGMDLRAPELLRRGVGVAALARDARGAATDLSPHNSDGSMLWSPYAEDGAIRDDLLQIIKPGGYFETNPDPNEGFINLGPQKDGDGPSWKPKVTNDRFMILQDIEPYDTAITELTEPFSVTPVDTGTPWVQRLRNNNPFSDESGNSLMEDPGKLNAVYARTGARDPNRQFLFFRVRYWDGKPIYSCDVIPRAKWDDLGNSKMDKKDSEAAELTYLPVRDGRCMAVIDGVYQPVNAYRIWGGSGYLALGGVPVFGAVAPVATQTGATTATVAHALPTGTGDPWTYAVEKAVSPFSSFTAATSTPSGTSTVTHAVTGLTTATAYKFRVIATGTNGASATSAVSNTATTS